MVSKKSPFERAITLAALSGLKMALGPAMLRTAQNRPSKGAWVTAALGEMALDKVGVFPSRFRLPLLIPHMAAGAWVAHESLKEDNADDHTTVLMAAVVAAGVACVAPMVRITASKVLGIPDPILGVGEDYLALKYGSEALGINMEQLPEIARDAIEQVGEQVMPTLEKAGLGR